VLAAVEISTLLIRVRPNLETLAVLQEAEAFPGNDAEGSIFLLSCVYASDFAIHMSQQKGSIENFNLLLSYHRRWLERVCRESQMKGDTFYS
jgi:hypothetical protein